MSDFSQYSGRIRVRASALIVQETSILLVQQFVPVKSEPVWLPPGGGVETGEEAEKALIREVMEETGCKVQPVSLRYVHEFISPPFHAVELYFIALKKEGVLKTGTDPEHPEDNQLIKNVAWIQFDSIPDIDLFPEFLRNEAMTGNLTGKGILHFRSVQGPM